jgi:hypothetical protein
MWVCATCLCGICKLDVSRYVGYVESLKQYLTRKFVDLCGEQKPTKGNDTFERGLE